MIQLNFYGIFGVSPAFGVGNAESKFKTWQYLTEDQ